jgi:D-galactose 1-dehydrogenase
VNQPLRLGLVGYGKIARDQHLPAIAAAPGMELAAVASRNAKADGVANYKDLEAMLAAEPDLDAVIMCQPPQSRFEAARMALLAGKHVFLEKPPGATLSEIEALVDLAGERGVTLFASWHSREAAAVRRASELLASTTIRSVQVSWKEDVRVWHPGQEWIWEPGGFGVFDRLISAELQVPSNRAAPIAANLSMQTASGAPILAEFDFRQSGPQSWDIVLDTGAGALVLGQGGNAITMNGADLEVSEEQEYPRLYARFVDLVSSGQSDVDVTPLRLVADAFMIGRWTQAEPFIH